jgi:hypothetical protein
VNRIHLTIRAQAASLTDASYACVVFGRLLISLIALLLPAMLWTERITTWDRFFQGGQDCEMSILALFAFLCLVILLGQRRKQSLARRLAVLRFFSLLVRFRHGAVATYSQFFSIAFRERVTSPGSGICLPPLRI